MISGFPNQPSKDNWQNGMTWKIVSNEQTIAETELHFESKARSFNKTDIEKLEERWSERSFHVMVYADE